MDLAIEFDGHGQRLARTSSTLARSVRNVENSKMRFSRSWTRARVSGSLWKSSAKWCATIEVQEPEGTTMHSLAAKVSRKWRATVRASSRYPLLNAGCPQ